MKHVFMIWQITPLIFGSIVLYSLHLQDRRQQNSINKVFMALVGLHTTLSLAKFLEFYGLINVEHNVLHKLNSFGNILGYFLLSAVFYAILALLFHFSERRKKYPGVIPFVLFTFSYFLLHFLDFFRYSVTVNGFHVCPPLGMIQTPVFLIVLSLIIFLVSCPAKPESKTGNARILTVLLLIGYLLFLLTSLYSSLSETVPTLSIFYLNIAIFVWYSRSYGKKIRLASGLSEQELAPFFQENYSLSNRELDVLTMLLKGKSNKEIEDALFISANTIRNHIAAIYKKIGVNSRGQLMSLIIKLQKKE